MMLSAEFLKRIQGFEGTKKNGDRHIPYICPAGHLTIGYGHNLDAKGLSEKVATMILVEDVQETIEEVIRRVPVFCELDSVRQEVLVDMAFNMGVDGLLKFEKMLGALGERDWARASQELLDSKYHGDVGYRAELNAKQLLTGERQ